MTEDVFALDVGTRSVVGLVLSRAGDHYKVRAVEMEEHQQRSMLDGQVHDIPLVAAVVARVKERLEKKVKHPLSEAAVAAAGRALQTRRGQAVRALDHLRSIDPGETLALQLEAVQAAQQDLAKDASAGDYHCVGYSVVRHTLDGSPIGNPVGQHGSSLAVEVIATFLPRIVVDSLHAVLQRAGLKISSLTLEPIAAIHVAVPPTMRQLNLALVDVGAGTSDIAITANGTVVGYAMVPSAGDEITEQLCAQYLLDFSTGEEVKRRLRAAAEVEFRDVVGMPHKLPAAELVAAIRPAVEELARQIGERILLLNGRAPQAVLLVGGGSLTPGLTDCLAESLGLPANRVAVRGREAVPHVTGGGRALDGPQAITPIGIALTSGTSLGFTAVQVNDRPVRVLNLGQPRVADALVGAGVSMRRLFGRPGRAMAVDVNGEIRFIKGGPPAPGRVLVNGREAGLDDLLREGDHVEVEWGRDGADAVATVGDLLPEQKVVYLNEQMLVLKPRAELDGKPAERGAPLYDGARLTWEFPATVGELLAREGFNMEAAFRITLNGREAGFATPLSDGDRLVVVPAEAAAAREGITVWFNDEAVRLAYPDGRAILSDLFTVVDVKPGGNPAGKKILMEINGAPASFTSPLKEGDRVTLRWED